MPIILTCRHDIEAGCTAFAVIASYDKADCFCCCCTDRQDSIEADSIIKSAKRADPDLDSGDSDSALGKTRLAANEAADTTTSQKNAVAGSLDHVKDNVVTDAKITDPEQEFNQGQAGMTAF